MGVFSKIEFLGAPFNKNGSFWILKLLKTLSKGYNGSKWLVFD